MTLDNIEWRKSLAKMTADELSAEFIRAAGTGRLDRLDVLAAGEVINLPTEFIDEETIAQAYLEAIKNDHLTVFEHLEKRDYFLGGQLFEHDLWLEAARLDRVAFLEKLALYTGIHDENPGHALYEAVKAGQKNAIDFLAKIENAQAPALALVAEAGDLKSLGYFADALKADFSKDGADALRGAAKGGHIDVFDYLLSRGAVVSDLVAQDSLCAAAAGGHTGFVHSLFERGDRYQKYKMDALTDALASGRIETTDFFIAQGIDIDTEVNPVGDTLAEHAASNGQAKLLAHLLDKGARGDFTKMAREAVSWNFTDVLDVLIQRNLDVNADNGCLLSMAASEGNDLLVQHLLKHGARIDVNYYQAVEDAVTAGKVLVVKIFCDIGIPMHAVKADSWYWARNTMNQAILDILNEAVFVEDKAAVAEFHERFGTSYTLDDLSRDEKDKMSGLALAARTGMFDKIVLAAAGINDRVLTPDMIFKKNPPPYWDTVYDILSARGEREKLFYPPLWTGKAGFIEALGEEIRKEEGRQSEKNPLDIDSLRSVITRATLAESDKIKFRLKPPKL